MNLICRKTKKIAANAYINVNFPKNLLLYWEKTFDYNQRPPLIIVPKYFHRNPKLPSSRLAISRNINCRYSHKIWRVIPKLMEVLSKSLNTHLHRTLFFLRNKRKKENRKENEKKTAILSFFHNNFCFN